MSLPASSPVSPAASAVAEPPEDPPGARARAVEIAHDDGVQRTVVLLDAREIQVQQLEAAELPLLDIGGELPGGAEGDLEHGRPPARSPETTERDGSILFAHGRIDPAASCPGGVLLGRGRPAAVRRRAVRRRRPALQPHRPDARPVLRPNVSAPGSPAG